MPVYDIPDLRQEPTRPVNVDQRPWFGTITETVKDAFILELRKYFNNKNDKIRLKELPRIDKYAVATDVLLDPLETAVSLVRSYPDILEDLPLVAVLSTTGRNNKLGLSDKFTSEIVYPAKIIGTTTEPFALTSGMDLTISTIPDGSAKDANSHQSRFIFPEFLFKDITAATLEEVVACINLQAKYSVAYISTDTAGVEHLSIRAGGHSGTTFPNKIVATGGTAMGLLGFISNQADQNYGSGKVAYTRQHMAADLTVAIEVVTESENVRTELSDLLYDFFAYVMADRKFQFYGRTVFSENILDEVYQIILKDAEFSFSGEQEMARSGDQHDKFYINRLSIPVTAILYSDRVIMNGASPWTPPANVNLLHFDDFPEPN